jgi:endonuclease YncB( thermonuclease family)
VLAATVGLAIAAFALTAPGRSTPPRMVPATVERVADGDTLTAFSGNATKLRIRLVGIDAPEIRHGRAPGQPFGAEAHDYLKRLVEDRPVRVESLGPDVYRRLLAVIWVGETNVNLEMVRAGLAEVYRGARCQVYCRELEEAERDARRLRRGMWAQQEYESPAVYRKRLRTGA